MAKAFKHASLATFAKPEAAAELMGQGKLDALEMGRDALVDLIENIVRQPPARRRRPVDRYG